MLRLQNQPIEKISKLPLPLQRLFFTYESEFLLNIFLPKSKATVKGSIMTIIRALTSVGGIEIKSPEYLITRDNIREIIVSLTRKLMVSFILIFITPIIFLLVVLSGLTNS